MTLGARDIILKHQSRPRGPVEHERGHVRRAAVITRQQATTVRDEDLLINHASHARIYAHAEQDTSTSRHRGSAGGARYLGGGRAITGLTATDFERVWARWDADAQSSKFSQGALLWLTEYYRGLDPADRQVADAVLLSWVTNGDVRQRFDALALVREFEITSTLPAVRAEPAWLRDAVGPPVASDREKLTRVVERLESGAACPSGFSRRTQPG